MKTLFWGTPHFALPSLRALTGEGHDVVGVVTRPDRPSGRGRKPRPTPVKEFALEEGLPVLEPEPPRGEEFESRIRELAPEISVVAAYGHILKPRVLQIPPRGSINVHASLLPKLRGAAPVNWAVIRGHERTGVTVMRMVEEMDAGPIIHQVEVPIEEDERASDLYVRLSELGAEALVAALAFMEAGAVEETEQDHSRATYAPKLDRSDARIDWSLDAREVANWIRGLDSVPGGWSPLEGDDVKVFRPRPLPDHEAAGEPGEILRADDRDGLVVACGSGAVRIAEVQPPGKRRMEAAAWIRGRGCEEGQRFG